MHAQHASDQDIMALGYYFASDYHVKTKLFFGIYVLAVHDWCFLFVNGFCYQSYFF